MRAGKSVKHAAHALGNSAGGLPQWGRQNRIDRGEIRGQLTKEPAERLRAKRRMQELGREFETAKRAVQLLGEEGTRPKDFIL